MSFHRDELDAIEAWIPTANALSGIYYRSVEYRFMDPKEVLNGKGAEVYGGRFVSIGNRAVFLAESDRAASEEVLARKRRLGGNAQTTLDRYPRIVFGVTVSLERVLGPIQEIIGEGVGVRSAELPRPRRFEPLDGTRRLLTRTIRPRARLSQRRRPGKEPDRLSGALPAAALEIHNAAELVKKMRQIVRRPK